MSLVLTSPPAVEPVSLVEAKAHLRVPHADDDGYIASLIIAARHWVEQRSGLRLINQGWSLFLDCWPESPLQSLGIFPVSAIGDVVTYSDADVPAIYDPAHYYLDSAAKPSRIVLRSNRLPPQGSRPVNGIEIRFTAGFGPAGTSVPQDLRHALLLIIAHWFQNRGDAEARVPPLPAIEIIESYRIMRLQ